MPTTGFFDELRAREFARLDTSNTAYLDFTGAGLYAASQIRVHLTRLERGVFGNPHSEHGPSRASTEVLDAARADVLAFLDADPAVYDVCFTANATAALKLVGEAYPFTADGAFILSADNHNSVQGIREYAHRARAVVHYLPLDDRLRPDDAAGRIRAMTGPGLVAFPAQSNFSGVKHPLSLVALAQARGFDVLLDAAAFTPTNALSLRTHAAEFVVLSFYKIFGFPTGVGALVAKRSALARLRRPWFAGGTVAHVSVQLDRYRLRPGHDALEDGTPNFLDVAALGPGFTLLRDVTMARLGDHVTALAARLLDGLVGLRHRSGAPLVRVYGPEDMTDRGATIAFNVLDAAGQVVPFEQVETRGREVGVAMRGGCFCNPGASERAFGLAPERVTRCLDALGDAFTIDRYRLCLGESAAVGAMRASLGLPSNTRDVDRALDVVASFGT